METHEITGDSPNIYADRSTPIRVLVAKPGLDGHDRGAKVITRALRDAGMEVIYSGLFQTPEMVVRSAVDEDVDVVGLSILSGAHLKLIPPIVEGLRSSGLSDVLVVVGGTIPAADIEKLRGSGVDEVFGPGTALTTVIDYMRSHAPRRDL